MAVYAHPIRTPSVTLEARAGSNSNLTDRTSTPSNCARDTAYSQSTELLTGELRYGEGDMARHDTIFIGVQGTVVALDPSTGSEIPQ